MQEKASNLSVQRAQAHDPIIIGKMFTAFGDFTQQLFVEGKIPSPYWENSQLFYGDEVGFDPDGKMLSVGTFSKQFRLLKKLVRVTSAEKAPFWVSVFFWVSGDGCRDSEPTVIHQVVVVIVVVAVVVDDVVVVIGVRAR